MLTIHLGHALDKLREMPDRSVHLILTSPPYYGLRDYGHTPLVWGAAESCEHIWGPPLRSPWANGLPGPNGLSKNVQATRSRSKESGSFCQVCGAWQGCLGQEPSIELYTEHLVIIFAEARRVLRDEGNLWVNLGDSYATSSTRWAARGAGGKQHRGVSQQAGLRKIGYAGEHGIPAKNLLGIPWRVALALQADGWILRNDVPWLKADGLPESVQDRHTRAHEYWFHFVKSKRSYWDRHAIMAEASESSIKRVQQATFDQQTGGEKDYGSNGTNTNRSARRTIENFAKNPARNARTTDMYAESLDDLITATRVYLAHLEHVRSDGGLLCSADGDPLALFVPTERFDEAHFATFPPRLIEPIIRAATSECGCCVVCSVPWVRVIGGESPDSWRPSCTCATTITPQPCTVLDPFFGAGTTGLVCKRLQRRCVGVEVKPEYIPMARARIDDEPTPIVVQIPARGSILVPGGKPRKKPVPDLNQSRMFEE